MPATASTRLASRVTGRRGARPMATRHEATRAGGPKAKNPAAPGSQRGRMRRRGHSVEAFEILRRVRAGQGRLRTVGAGAMRSAGERRRLSGAAGLLWCERCRCGVPRGGAASRPTTRFSGRRARASLRVNQLLGGAPVAAERER
jgi:hypothetical protein